MKPPRSRRKLVLHNHDRNKQPSLKSRLLACLHCRKALIVVCTLVVLECMCVMAELMVDLQGIRVRFENEEKEVSKFVHYMKAEDPVAFASFEGRSLEEVLYVLYRSTELLNLDNTSNCPAGCDVSRVDTTRLNGDQAVVRRRRSPSDLTEVIMKANVKDIQVETKDNSRDLNHQRDDNDRGRYVSDSRTFESETASDTENNRRRDSNADVKFDLQYSKSFKKHVRDPESKSTKTEAVSEPDTPRVKRNAGDSVNVEGMTKKVFVFTVNTADENFYMVTRFKDIDPSTQGGNDVIEDMRKYSVYTEHYKAVNKVSHIIKYIGFGILTLMLFETVLKFACLGLDFFKKKIEVFDAFIVIISFALDVVFIDSSWYDTGKDATTILVLLLPWRVVRIVNSFIMTINHKHHLEMMWVRKAKKKTEVRLKKLQNLTMEIRRDIDLLIALAKSKGASKTEITSCIYGRGRGQTTLAAITGFAHLMLISTLGKDPRIAGQFQDDLYGDMIQKIIQEDEEEEEEEGTEKGFDGDDDDTTPTGDDVEAQIKSDDDEDEDVGSLRPRIVYSVPKRSRKIHRRHSRNTGSLRHGNVSSRTVLPRRSNSEDSGGNVYYINDAFVSPDADGTTSFNNRTVSSLPVITSGSNYVTFEVTTQVTYL